MCLYLYELNDKKMVKLLWCWETCSIAAFTEASVHSDDEEHNQLYLTQLTLKWLCDGAGTRLDATRSGRKTTYQAFLLMLFTLHVNSTRKTCITILCCTSTQLARHVL